METTGHWEQQAANWIRWARTPGHDAYWDYSPSFFEDIVPPAGRSTLEIGCGEGRVARDLRDRGHRVVALDSSPTLLEAAHEADPDSQYVLAEADRLPFHAETFDLVVAYNSLMDVSDMPKTVSETARVLSAGARLCACVTHPISDAGTFESADADALFVIEGTYYGRRPFKMPFERDGLEMTFQGWCYALQDYSRALEAAGFAIELLREPSGRAEAVASNHAEARWQRIPMFLQFRAVKLA